MVNRLWKGSCVSCFVAVKSQHGTYAANRGMTRLLKSRLHQSLNQPTDLRPALKIEIPLVFTLWFVLRLANSLQKGETLVLLRIEACELPFRIGPVARSWDEQDASLITTCLSREKAESNECLHYESTDRKSVV